jgi:hypothetical protein
MHQKRKGFGYTSGMIGHILGIPSGAIRKMFDILRSVHAASAG